MRADMGKWIAEFELEDGDTMPEHMDLNYRGAKIDFYCKPLNQEPCKDAISRQAVITVIKDWWGKGVIAIDDIRKLPPVTPTRKEWIPVSERLPKESVDVICCTDAKEVFIASYLGKLDDGTECFDDDNGMMCEGDVVAWMPLPEPYKEGAKDVYS